MNDPYEAIIEHYGRLEFSDILEIGRTKSDHNFIEPRTDLGASFPDAYDSRLINFRLINESGRVPLVMKWEGSDGIYYQNNPDDPYWGSQRIDWYTQDEFNAAYEEILQNCIERIEANPAIYNLRIMPAWGHDERVAWEREISAIVSEEMDAIPGLDIYRLANEAYPETSLRAQWINVLSDDILQGTAKIEHDCETMTLIEGSILQRLDENFLPRRTVESLQDGNLMVRSNYFYAMGYVSFDPSDTQPGGHAFIVSSATGNIIEATIDPNVHFSSPYIQSANPTWSFERFVRGEVFEGHNQYVYGGSLDTYLENRAASTPEQDWNPDVLFPSF